MRDSVPSTRYSSVCNVLRQWNIPLIPTYRVYRLYDIESTDSMIYNKIAAKAIPCTTYIIIIIDNIICIYLNYSSLSARELRISLNK